MWKKIKKLADELLYISKLYEHGLGFVVARAFYTVKPVYNDHLMGYFSAFWSSSRWPRAT